MQRGARTLAAKTESIVVKQKMIVVMKSFSSCCAPDKQRNPLGRQQTIQLGKVLYEKAAPSK